MPELHVGTASWTDPSLIESGAFYPPDIKTPEERLRFYAEQFDSVEVDSTYYALPAERNAVVWSERTPDEFIFHIKAFALLTRHGAETKRLPKAIKQLLKPEELQKTRLSDPTPEVRDLAFQMFERALEHLKSE